MSNFFGYVRVSTARQGDGVSLQEQRAAIERCAQKHQLTISAWFEERETAARHGRPVFSDMMRQLKRGQARGVIIHKIDRSARNLRDWADLGELIDNGIDVKFAGDNLDLTSRSGRLSADIQAVVAADYIRNLREETRKGIEGRLKQGLYPFPAPIGYRDCGAGLPKQPDPVTAPLVRRAFELYGSGQFSLRSLRHELHEMGLRNRQGGELSLNGLLSLLRNPFYTGNIRIKKSGAMHRGNHEPIISVTLFERVQRMLDGKSAAQTIRHAFLLRRLVRCHACGYTLIGERQKGHVYYRCHSPGCRRTCLREELIEAEILKQIQRVRITAEERAEWQLVLDELAGEWKSEADQHRKSVQLQLASLSDRLDRMTDAFIDGAIERAIYERRKVTLLLEQQRLQEEVQRFDDGKEASLEKIAKIFELAEKAYLSYKSVEPTVKREWIEILTSNCRVDGKNVSVELSEPFDLIVERPKIAYGGACRDRPRTWVGKLVEYVRNCSRNHKRLTGDFKNT